MPSKKEEKSPVDKPRQWVFTVDEGEIASIEKWRKEHDKTCRYGNPANCGSIGGRLTYSFTGTSLGVIVKVECACGEEHDATDYLGW